MTIMFKIYNNNRVNDKDNNVNNKVNHNGNNVNSTAILRLITVKE